jgi:hypothetical protein
MTDAQALLTKVYEAYNRRGFTAFTALADGRTRVEVDQAARSQTDQAWSGQDVRHCYTLRDGLISRMDMVDDEEPSRAP